MTSVMAPMSDAPSTAPRASARVRSQPNYASSPFSSAKRKRNEEEANADEEEDMLDEPSDEDDDPEDEEPAEEELREKKKKARKPKSSAPKKPAQKKPKVNGISLPIRGAAKAPAKKRAPKKTKAADVEDAEAAGGLFAELFARNKLVEEIVKDWLSNFADHESNAMADLVNFVLKAAGCNSKVTHHDLEDPDGATARLTDLQEEHQATEPTDYPMIAKGKNAPAFKANVMHFITTLIKATAARGILSDDPDFLENIHVWFSTMTSATNRSFRHTSTVCSLAVVDALCEVAQEYSTKSSDNQRHADVERKKARPNKERIKQIEQKAKDAAADEELAGQLLTDWFDTVFIHRYRDVDAAVRRDCVAGLGNWIVTLPVKFLDGNHLRYMGWLLSDESAVARLETLKQLRRLYTDSDMLSGLKTFTERFRSRMVEIGTSDADIGVRVAGIELLDLLRANDLLEPDDIDAVGRLIFHEDLKIRKAVARFFSANVKDLYSAKIEELGGEEGLLEVLPDVDDDDFEPPRLEWLTFKSIGEMLKAYDYDETLPSQVERNQDGCLLLHAAGVNSRFTLAVDALYDDFEELEDWEVLAGYLLFDNSSGRAKRADNDPLSQYKHETVLTEDEEVVLLEVLNASVKRTMSDLAEKITGTKGKLTKQQKEYLQEEQEEAVRHLTDLIPKLLKKFGDVPGTAGAVLRLGGTLALPSLQGLRQDSTASAALLDDLRKQFMSHGTDEVLAPATAAILHAQSYGELDEASLEKVSSLWEDVVSNLAEIIDVKTTPIRGASEHEELLALGNNLLRIVRLSTVSNCIAPLEDTGLTSTHKSSQDKDKAAIDFIAGLTLRAVHSSDHSPDPDEAAMEDMVATRAIEAALFYFRWKLTIMMTAIKTGSNAEVAYEILEALAGRRDIYVDNLVAVLNSRKAGDPVSIAAAGSLLELFTSSAILRTEQAQPGMAEDYDVLIMDLDAVHENAVMKVFVAVEKEFARLSGKKLETIVSEEAEPDVDADPIDDEPLSDDDADDEEEEMQTQDSRRQRDMKLLKPVIVEERLCQLATKLVWAILAGIIDDKATRKRLERNKAKLGANYKEVLAYLDVGKKVSRVKVSKAKGKGTATAAKKTKADPKSHAIVAEDDEEDDIEDEEVEVEERRDVDDELPADNDDVEMANGADEDSVAGD